MVLSLSREVGVQVHSAAKVVVVGAAHEEEADDDGDVGDYILQAGLHCPCRFCFRTSWLSGPHRARLRRI